jgi:hypothetical protein
MKSATQRNKTCKCRNREFGPTKHAAVCGFTRGDGGFQTEVGFGDLALGLAALFCIRCRDRYWLAILIVATVSLWGDAYGHIDQEIVNDDHDPDNTGPVLYADIVVPLVGLALYGALERLRTQERSLQP